MNLRFAVSYFTLCLLLLGLGLGMHHALQNEAIYRATTGRFMPNYQREGGWQDYRIESLKIPYPPISENNLSNWDAAIYRCIRDHGYAKGHNCYDDFKASFLPGFPALWRLTGLGFRGISLVNYALYALAVFLALHWWGRNLSLTSRLFCALLLLTFPSGVIYSMPYSEALFSLSGVVLAQAYRRQWPWLFFLLSIVFFSSRLAALFVLVAAVTVALFSWRRSETKMGGLYLALLFLGALLALGLYQLLVFTQTGNWGAYFAATDLQTNFFRWPKSLSDWSHESYALSLSAIGLLLLPAMAWALAWLSGKTSWPGEDRWGHAGKVALLYLAGLALFTLLHSAGSIHSLHRFVFCSPALLVLLFQSRPQPAWRAYVPFLALLLAFLGGFLAAYAGMQWRPAYWGGVLTVFYALAWAIGPKKGFMAWSVAVLSLFGLWWATYLHAQYLSNAWIFT